MARGVRQGCPASGFLFAIAFNPIFRSLPDAIIPRNPDGLDFLQPAQCAYADDFAVAALSFRDLMTALAPAFHSVDHIGGLKLNSCNMVVKDVSLYCVGCQKTVRIYERCRLSDMPNTLAP